MPGSGVRVLLVNMPFAAIDQPSIALGLFKAQLRERGIACDVADLNVRFAQQVGWDSYDAVHRSSSTLAGEQMFSEQLFAGYVPSYEEYAARVLPRLDDRTRSQLYHLKIHVPHFLSACLRQFSWADYDIIGFSTMFEQNLSSLSLAHLIKRHFPDKTIVFGGANCEEIMGRTLHECFPFVDIVCSGEASVTFPELVLRLTHGHPIEDLPGIVYRAGSRSIDTGPPTKLRELDSLPAPDYDDYFRTIEGTRAPITPSLPIETARGCWWGEKVMCTFCGLNGQSIAFRAKSPERALEEVLELTRKYPVGFVRAVDNMMPPSYYEGFLPELAEANPGVEFFYEVRPDLSKREIAALARARITRVQAGVESLDTHILKLMRKGTTGLANIELLRWCQMAGITVDWNLLFGFPGERREDYQRNLDLARVLTHLRPPSSIGKVRLDRFSANFEQAAEIGFTRVRPWSLFRYVYPFSEEILADLVYYFDHEDEVEVDTGGTFEQLREHVQRWQRRQDKLYCEESSAGRLVIRDTRPVARSPEVHLNGIESAIYGHCDSRRRVADVMEWLRESCGMEVASEAVAAILDDFVSRDLMVEEGGRYLSLAIFGQFADQRSGAEREAAHAPVY